jgi:hypothetical protein
MICRMRGQRITMARSARDPALHFVQRSRPGRHESVVGDRDDSRQ